MIIRKPFKFLIEHFKKINVIFLVLISFIIYKLFNIMRFFSKFVSNSYMTNEVNLASRYVGYILPIAIIIIIAINIIIIILFKSKDKDTKSYVISTIFYIIILAFCSIYSGVLDDFEFNTIESSTALLYRDISKFTFYPNFIFIIFYFLNFIGFDLKTFEFTNLRDDIDIANEDDAEIEIGVQVEDYKIKRSFRRTLRELKYYIYDNKLVFTFIGGACAIIILWGTVNLIMKYSNTVRVDKAFTYSNFNITVENSYLTTLDYSGNKLSDKYHYLVIVLSVTNKSSAMQTLDTDNFWLVIGNTYIYPILDKSGYFVDLGEPYYKDKIESNVNHKYVLVYSIEESEIRKNYEIKILDSVKYVDGEGTPTYKTLKVSPRENDNINDNGTYAIGDTLDFSKSTLGSTSLSLSDYSLQDSYTYDYNYCYQEECTLKKNVINNTSNTTKTLMVLDSSLVFDENTNYVKYSQSKFYDNFVTFEYIYRDKTYTSSATNKTASNDISSNTILEVDYNMKYATSIKMIISIRNQKYTINLL